MKLTYISNVRGRMGAVTLYINGVPTFTFLARFDKCMPSLKDAINYVHDNS